jgi:hypothetical protein
LVNAFNLDKEKLAAEKEKILARKKEAETQLKKILKKEKAVTVREETTIGMTFWRFFSKNHTDEYKKIIHSDEFREYVTTPYPRKLFGFDELPEEGGKKEEEVTGNEGRTYLEVPFGEKESAKKAGAKWDASGRKWYVPEGVDLKLLSKWLPASGSGGSEGQGRADRRVEEPLPPVAPDETPENESQGGDE